MPRDGESGAAGLRQPGRFDAIPHEMRTWHQWVCWRYGTGPTGKPTKLPIQAQNGQLADVTIPDTWDTFDAAAAAVDLWGANGIGFVFGPDDPYAGIDLDDAGDDAALAAAHRKIVEAFPSYTEVSPSGRGLHIIVRGSIQGARKHGVEAYSTGRYFTMTGQVHRDLPIITADKDDLAELQAALAPGRAPLGFLSTVPETVPDHVVVERMRTAKNGEKAMRLAAGDASALDGSDRSGSALDMALVNCIAFHTQCVPQIERLWLSSEHGQNARRLKKLARVGYRMGTIRRALDRAVVPVDMGVIQAEWAAKRAGAAPAAPASSRKETHTVPVLRTDKAPKQSRRFVPQVNPHDVPPGLIGELAQFIHASAPRPVPEIALAGAIAWMAGVCGKAYNINDAGLNLYIALLASSGTGKEAVSTGYSAIETAVAKKAPAIRNFSGPADFASPQGCLKFISRQRSAFCLVSEFGNWLSQMTGKDANPNRSALKYILMQVFTKSGRLGTYRPTLYADKDNDIPEIKAPALTLLGETTPVTFYGAIDQKAIEDGFLPRFVIIEYEGGLPPINKNARFARMPDRLADDLANLAMRCDTLNSPDGGGPYDIGLDLDATLALDEFSAYCDTRWRETDNEGIRNVWSRVWLNAAKLSALAAVACNPLTPVVTAAHVAWGTALAAHSTEKIVGKIEGGDVAGSQEAAQYAALRRCLLEIPTYDERRAASYKLTVGMCRDRVINTVWIHDRVSKLAPFTADRQGPAAAWKRVLARAEDEDLLRLTNHAERHPIGGLCYIINPALFDG